MTKLKTLLANRGQRRTSEQAVKFVCFIERFAWFEMNTGKMSLSGVSENGTDVKQRLTLGSCEEKNPEWKAFVRKCEPEHWGEDTASAKKIDEEDTKSGSEKISATNDGSRQVIASASSTEKNEAPDCASDLDEDDSEPAWVKQIWELNKDRLTIRDHDEWEGEIAVNEAEGSSRSHPNSAINGSVEYHSQAEKCDNETNKDDSETSSSYSEERSSSLGDDNEFDSDEKSSASEDEEVTNSEEEEQDANQQMFPRLQRSQSVENVDAVGIEAPQSTSLASIELSDAESVGTKNSNHQESHGNDSCSTLTPSVSSIWTATDNEESPEETQSEASLQYNRSGALKNWVSESNHPNEIRVNMGYEADDEQTETNWTLEAWQRRKEMYVSLWVQEVNRALFPHWVEKGKENHSFEEKEDLLAKLTPPTNANLSDAPRALTNNTDQEAHRNDSGIACGFESEATASTYEADNEESAEDTSSDESERGQLFRIKSSKIDERGYESDDDEMTYEGQCNRWKKLKRVAVSRWVDDVHKRMFPNTGHNAAGIRGRLSQVWTRFSATARRVFGRCIPRCCVGDVEQ